MAHKKSWLGGQIKAARTFRSMSLQDVADEAGLTKSHVWELESGRAKNPTISTLLGLAVALNVAPKILAIAAFADQPGVRSS